MDNWIRCMSRLERMHQRQAGELGCRDEVLLSSLVVKLLHLSVMMVLLMLIMMVVLMVP